MQKKNLMIGIGLFFLSAITVPVLGATTAETTPIQEGLAIPSQAATEATSTATDSGAIKKSDYALPYPGILPNHPLYFVKKLRDRVIEMLVVDPQRKSEFDLLQSDKFLAASVLLDQQSQTQWAQTMIDQSSQRMIDAVAQLSSMKQNGRPVPAGSIDRMQQAIEKHLEVLDDLTAKKTVSTSSARDQLLQAGEELAKLQG